MIIVSNESLLYWSRSFGWDHLPARANQVSLATINNKARLFGRSKRVDLERILYSTFYVSGLHRLAILASIGVSIETSSSNGLVVHAMIRQQ